MFRVSSSYAWKACNFPAFFPERKFLICQVNFILKLLLFPDVCIFFLTFASCNYVFLIMMICGSFVEICHACNDLAILIAKPCALRITHCNALCITHYTLQCLVHYAIHIAKP